MKKKITKLVKRYQEFIKFVFVGVSNVIVSLIIYYICIYFGIYYQIANVIAFLLGTLNAYVLSKLWVFKVNNSEKAQVFKFYFSYFCTWLVGAMLLFLWVEIMNIPESIAPIINIFITTPLNYISSKLWTFKKK